LQDQTGLQIFEQQQRLKLKESVIQHLHQVDVEDGEECQIYETLLSPQPQKRDDTDPNQTKQKYDQ
jgi:hypothetical protein